ncbi:hypothetical protein BX285_1561 [Streptomyces sp. 1114.5]|nr:hypothetical protein BX285_1561 [Streptomyces sp. 1114.5]
MSNRTGPIMSSAVPDALPVDDWVWVVANSLVCMCDDHRCGPVPDEIRANLEFDEVVCPVHSSRSQRSFGSTQLPPLRTETFYARHAAGPLSRIWHACGTRRG